MLPSVFTTRRSRYRDIRCLGEGGMGQVYLARDVELDREVALKVPILDAEGLTEARSRFLREARLLALVEHHRIVRVYDVVDDDPPYMVQELLQGETLEERLRRGPLSADEARVLSVELEEALEELHGAEVVHRDLKPANLFLRRHGGLCLLDFGLARRIDQTRLTDVHSFVGSLLWVSPEMVDGRPPTSASDVYQAGLIVHHALTGRPLDRPDPPTWPDLLKVADPSRPTPEPDRAIPADLAAWIRACCLVDPARRRLGVRAPAGEAPSFSPRDSGPISALTGPGPSLAGRLRFRPLVAALVLAALVAAVAIRGRRTIGPGPSSSSSEGLVPSSETVSSSAHRVLLLPEALWIRFAEGVGKEGELALLVDGGHPVRSPLEDRYGRLEGEAKLPAGWRSVHLTATVDGRVLLARTWTRAELAPALEAVARLAEKTLWIERSFLPGCELDHYVGIDGGRLTRRGRHGARAALAVPAIDEGNPASAVAWQIRAGSLVLAEGRVRPGVRRRWEPPVGRSFVNDSIVDVVVEGDRLFMQSIKGQLLELSVLDRDGMPTGRLDRIVDLNRMAQREAGYYNERLVGRAGPSTILICNRPSGLMLAPDLGPARFVALPAGLKPGLLAALRGETVQIAALTEDDGLDLLVHRGDELLRRGRLGPRWRKPESLTWAGDRLWAAGREGDDGETVVVMAVDPDGRPPRALGQDAFPAGPRRRPGARRPAVFQPLPTGGFLVLVGNHAAWRREATAPLTWRRLDGPGLPCAAKGVTTDDGRPLVAITWAQDVGEIGVRLSLGILDWAVDEAAPRHRLLSVPTFEVWESTKLNVIGAVAAAGGRFAVAYGFRVYLFDPERDFAATAAHALSRTPRIMFGRKGRLLLLDDMAKLHSLDLPGFAPAPPTAGR